MSLRGTLFPSESLGCVPFKMRSFLHDSGDKPLAQVSALMPAEV